MDHWGQHIASWAARNDKKPSIVEGILIRKGWDPDKYLPNMKDDLNYYLDQWYELSIKKLPAPATARRRNPYYRRNADEDLRILERSDDPEDQARLLRQQIRLSRISLKQLELLAALGFQPAVWLTGEGGERVLDATVVSAEYPSQPKQFIMSPLDEVFLKHHKTVICRYAYEVFKVAYKHLGDVSNKIYHYTEDTEMVEAIHGAETYMKQVIEKIERWFLLQKRATSFTSLNYSLEHRVRDLKIAAREIFREDIDPYSKLQHPINHWVITLSEILRALGCVTETLACSWRGKNRENCIGMARNTESFVVAVLGNIAGDAFDPDIQDAAERHVATNTAEGIYNWMLETAS